ncbi:hypothetical protein ACFFX0_06615 [Citricoccus parietis]|uniref:Uncharacterized protein n=1 Tax=Citricoccus parietis TaxID=592307 RepID=A0ABV5FW17_9MICC
MISCRSVRYARSLALTGSSVYTNSRMWVIRGRIGPELVHFSPLVLFCVYTGWTWRDSRPRLVPCPQRPPCVSPPRPLSRLSHPSPLSRTSPSTAGPSRTRRVSGWRRPLPSTGPSRPPGPWMMRGHRSTGGSPEPG